MFTLAQLGKMQINFQKQTEKFSIMEHPIVIIDNNPENVRAIQIALENFQEEFICVGAAATEQDGLDLILEKRPSLVFLNLEMPGSKTKKTQYTLIQELKSYLDLLPEVVVMANNTSYAVEGIRNDVLDYIINPLKQNHLRRCLLRFSKLNKERVSTSLCFKSYGDYKFINANEILYLKADNNTTDIVMNDGKVNEAFKTLKCFHESLPSNFVRIHNSYIVNEDFISRIHFGKSKCKIKNTNIWVPFSKSYRANVECIKDSLSNRSLMIA